MRITLNIIAVLGMAALVSFAPILHGDGTYTTDVSKSNIEWVGKKLTGQHSGTLTFKSGEIKMGGHGISSANFVIDMTTITCTDLKGESKEDLESHLRSDDFFGTKKHPMALIKLVSATALTEDKNGNNFTIKANLTIKGITNEITFPAKVTIGDKQVKLTAKLVFDRTKWGIKYKSKTIFDDLADKFIYDDIDMNISVVANLK